MDEMPYRTYTFGRWYLADNDAIHAMRQQVASWCLQDVPANTLAVLCCHRACRLFGGCSVGDFNGITWTCRHHRVFNVHQAHSVQFWSCISVVMHVGAHYWWPRSRFEPSYQQILGLGLAPSMQQFLGLV